MSKGGRAFVTVKVIVGECPCSRYRPFASSTSDIEHTVDAGEIQLLWEHSPRFETREVKLKQAREPHTLFPFG